MSAQNVIFSQKHAHPPREGLTWKPPGQLEVAPVAQRSQFLVCDSHPMRLSQEPISY